MELGAADKIHVIREIEKKTNFPIAIEKSKKYQKSMIELEILHHLILYSINKIRMQRINYSAKTFAKKKNGYARSTHRNIIQL